MSALRKPRKTLLFDTLEQVKKLEAAGFPQKQAEAQVRLFSEILEENICSKQDLLETEGRIEVQLKDLEVKLKDLEGRIEVKLKDLEGRIEVKLKDLEGRIEVKLKGLETNIREFEGRIEVKLKDLEGRLLKWFIGTFFLAFGMMTGIMTVFVKLMH